MENVLFTFCGITNDNNGTGNDNVVENEIRIYKVDLNKTKEITELFEYSIRAFVNNHYTEEIKDKHGYNLNTLLFLVEKELGLKTVKLPCNVAHAIKVEFEY